MEKLKAKLTPLTIAAIVIGVLVVIAIVIAIVISFSEPRDGQGNSNDNQSNRQNSLAEDNAPVLYNLGGVEFKPYDSASGTAGDIYFTKDTLHVADGLETPIVIFGQKLPSSPGQPQRINPNFEFRGLAKPIDLVSAIDGVVVFVRSQPEANDYELFLSAREGSNWVIGYDHVTDLQVEKGDSVRVGQVLGKAALERGSYYRYELQINHEQPNDNTTMSCPSTLLAPNVKDKYAQQLTQLQLDWAKWYGKEGTFPQNTGGCVKDVLTAKESEGR